MSEILPADAVAEMLAIHAASTGGTWSVNGISPGGGSHRFDLKMAGARSRFRTAEYMFHANGVPPTDPEDAEECAAARCCDCGPGKVKHDQEEADLRFMAHAHNTLPALCASHEAQARRIEALEAEAAWLSEHTRFQLDRIAALEEGVQRYGAHPDRCGRFSVDGDGECDCGLEALLATPPQEAGS